MNIWLAGVIFTLAGWIVKWIRDDIKGVSIKISKEQAKRRKLIAAIIDDHDETEKLRKYTDLLRED